MALPMVYGYRFHLFDSGFIWSHGRASNSLNPTILLYGSDRKN
jgi:hypothetical protein